MHSHELLSRPGFVSHPSTLHAILKFNIAIFPIWFWPVWRRLKVLKIILSCYLQNERNRSFIRLLAPAAMIENNATWIHQHALKYLFGSPGILQVVIIFARGMTKADWEERLKICLQYAQPMQSYVFCLAVIQECIPRVKVIAQWLFPCRKKKTTDTMQLHAKALNCECLN